MSVENCAIQKKSPQRSPTDIALDRHLSPVNKLAARVVSKGEHWNTVKIILTADSINPCKTLPPDKLSGVEVGMRFGYLRVIGRVAESDSRKTVYLCKCLCGYYVQRTAKAIKNPRNSIDACEICRQKQYLARKDEFRQHGRNREFWSLK